jgi:hypothetical protein
MTSYILGLKTTVVASGSTPPKKTHLCTDMDQEFGGQDANRRAVGAGGAFTEVFEGSYGALIPQRVGIPTFNSPPSIANIPERAPPRSILNAQTFDHQQTQVQIRISGKERG